MNNTKIGNSEAIASVLIIMINLAVFNITKTLIYNFDSATLLNIVYVSIIAIITSIIIYKLFKNFPTFDILDISNMLGGRVLKVFSGLLFFAYFIFFAAILLNNLSLCLQIIYYESTHLFFIALFFIIGAIFCCTLKYNSIYRSNLLIVPLLLIGIIFLFACNFKNYHFDNIFPLLGKGANNTFVVGLNSLFAFQGFAYLYFLPPILKKPNSFKKICITSISLSALYLFASVSIVFFMFNAFVDTDELLPLFSSVRYVEFGLFFQRLDSIFMLTLIISFMSYLCIVITTCSNILKKIAPINSFKCYVFFSALLILIISLFPKNYAISSFISNTICKYAFFVLVIAFSLSILILANLKKKKF